MTSDHLRETLASLDAEWRHLVESDPPQPRAWRRDCPAFAGASGLAGVVSAIAADPDRALLHLLEVHAGGDALAGRVVLQAVLGKLVLLARTDPAASLDDYLAAAWERIATYPTSRRTSVAANLVLDALKAVKREQRRPAATPPVAPREPDAASILWVASDLGLIDPTAVATLEAVYLDGCSGVDAARRLGTTPGAVRVRCHRAVRALRSHAAELATAASQRTSPVS